MIIYRHSFTNEFLNTGVLHLLEGIVKFCDLCNIDYAMLYKKYNILFLNRIHDFGHFSSTEKLNLNDFGLF